MKKSFTRKLEEYLEAIYEIKRKQGKKVVKIKDVAEYMKVSMPSVTDAMNRLAQLGLVDYQKREYLDLTEKGYEIAEDLHKREELLTKFLADILLLDQKLSRENACKIEHELDPIIVKRLETFIRFIEECMDIAKIREDFHSYLEKRSCERKN